MDIDALMDRARAVAEQSPNRRRRVGAVFVAADGTAVEACNDYPAGVRDLDERHEGDGRFIWMEHAERGALFAAARRGVATEGGVLFCNLYPCYDCARAIVQSGVRQVYAPAPDFADPSWGAAFRISQTILAEGGVEAIAVAGPPAHERDPAALEREQAARAAQRATSGAAR